MKKFSLLLVLSFALLIVWAPRVHAALTFTPSLPQPVSTPITVNCSNPGFHYYIYDDTGNVYANDDCANPYTFQVYGGNYTVVEYGQLAGHPACSDLTGTLGDVRSDTCYIQEAPLSVIGPVIYYFNNAVDQSPDTLGNYWFDSKEMFPATQLPNINVDEVTVTDGSVFNGDATFRVNAVNFGEVTGNATFHDTSLNNNLIDGDATFYDDSHNNNLLGHNAFFHDNSQNQGEIINTAIFYGDTTENLGVVDNTKTRYYTADTTPARDFLSDGPWTILADNVVVDLSTANADNNTTFTKVGTGSFIAGYHTYYFNNAVSQSPTDLGNYWNDNGLSDPALHLPDFSVDEVFVVNGATFNGDAIFNYGATNSGTVSGNATFIGGNERNFGIIIGGGGGGSNAFGTFAENNGIVEGDATFNNGSGNFSGTILGNAFFHDTTGNVGTINGDASFYDNSANFTYFTIFGFQTDIGTVNGNATFYNDASENNGGVVHHTKIRRYIVDTVTTRDFVTTRPWTVIADGAAVDATGSTHNITTTFSILNNGSFVGPATHLVFSTQPAGSTSGQLLTTQPVVQAQNIFGSRDVSYNGTIQLTLATGTGQLIGTTTVNAISGVANFSNLIYLATRDAQPFSLHATSGSLTAADSSSITPTILASGSGGSVYIPPSPIIVTPPPPTPPAIIYLPPVVPPTIPPITYPVNKTLSNRLKGKLLLAVEDHGRVWYVDFNGFRHEITLTNALDIFRTLSLGISNKNLALIPGNLGNKLKGRFLLQVQSHGEIWYVDFSGNKHKVTKETLLDFCRSLALGITQQNLVGISIGN